MRKHPRELTPALIRRYAACLREQERAPATIQKYVRDLTALSGRVSRCAPRARVGWRTCPSPQVRAELEALFTTLWGGAWRAMWPLETAYEGRKEGQDKGHGTASVTFAGHAVPPCVGSC